MLWQSFQYLLFLELTFTGPFTSAVSSYMKLKNPSDKKVPTIEMWWVKLFIDKYYPRCASRSRRQHPRGTAWSPTQGWSTQTMRSRSQSASSPSSKYFLNLNQGDKVYCIAQVWPKWEEQAQVYGAVNVCTRWGDQSRHPGQLLFSSYSLKHILSWKT